MAWSLLKSMWHRVDIDRDESDVTFCLTLLYFGELVTKLTVLGLLAAIQDDTNRSRYKQLHRLVRANGIGEWAESLDTILTGPPASFLSPSAQPDRRQLIEKVGSDSWQYRAVTGLRECLSELGANSSRLPPKIQCKLWFHMFAELRNRTRGHGALPSPKLSAICQPLHDSIKILTSELALLQRSWAHLHQNLSGKYRVTPVINGTEPFDYLKRSNSERLSDGVYLSFEEDLVQLDLIKANDTATDLFVANGSYTEENYEMLSYLTGDIIRGDSRPFRGPADQLPRSETHGERAFEVLGDSLTNAPRPASDYVTRENLESELVSLLEEDRHPIVTLVGRGGIGKTSLSLAAIKKIAEIGRFDIIVWFSARDIDLLPEGPKQVRPDVLRISDFARLYCDLMGSKRQKQASEITKMRHALGQESEVTTLFVFDNFETVADQGDTYRWLDANIRNPNKILITTRTRHFKADYPLTVGGMTETECNQLIDTVSRRLGVFDAIGPQYRQELYEESGGHPYVIKMLLGTLERGKPVRKVKRILASQEEILPALFERTYGGLSAASQRIFLTLSNWNSTVPLVAIQAALLRASERIDVDGAVDELARNSLIETSESEIDQHTFISVPITAQVFGKRRLTVSSIRSTIDADTEFLRKFGPGGEADVRKGLEPKLGRYLKSISKDVDKRRYSLEDAIPVLEYLARSVPRFWVDIAGLYEENKPTYWVKKAMRCIKEYIISLEEEADSPQKLQGLIKGWKQLADLSAITRNIKAELNAVVGLVRVRNIDFYEISNAANRFNSRLATSGSKLESEDKRILARDIAFVMSHRADEASATDLSRLAWLYMHLGDDETAKMYTLRGLEKHPSNIYCGQLAKRLRIHNREIQPL